MNTQANTAEQNGIAVAPDPMLAQFQAYTAAGGALAFEAWSRTVNGIVAAMPERKASTATTARKARRPSTASRADVKASKKSIPSKRQSKGNGKHNPNLSDKIDLAAQHVAEERKAREATRTAIRLFESSPVKKDAAVACALYFGQGTVKGMSMPLWRAKFESQREAVSYMWNIANTPDNKPVLDAKVQLMVRLRADGYRALKIAPPVKKGGRDKAPIVDRAVSASRRFLDTMSNAERREFLSRVADAVKELNAPSKKRAA